MKKLWKELWMLYYNMILKIYWKWAREEEHLPNILLKYPAYILKQWKLDEEKVNYLLKQFPSLQENLIHQSFLSIDRPFEEPFTVIGNFPYNISTQILFKILEWKEYVPVVIGMFQKEVAERAAAKEGSKIYGVLSVLLQYYYELNIFFSGK